MRLLWQFVHKYWIAFGLGAIFFDALKRLGGQVMGLLTDKYDQKVWDAIKQPKYAHNPGGQVQYPGVPPPKQTAYTVAEIAATLGRKEFMVTYSLKRLEKRGARETHEGWLVKI